MPKVTLNTVPNTPNNSTVINNNFTKLANAIENTLSLDGTTPNAMNADLDMNSQNILNVDDLDVNDVTINGVPLVTYINENLDSSVPAITSGSGVPSSTPEKIGDIYIDTLNENIYMASDTTSSADWEQVDATVGAVDSVNTQTGAVVLDADDISDAATTNKFTTSGDIAKLAGIEANATADQTGAEIKALYEAEADTNAFTDAEQTKLAGIETGADVTDSANVTAALSNQTVSGYTVFTNGVLTGQSDATMGYLYAFGAGTGSTAGGQIRLYTAADYDTTIDYYLVRATADDFAVTLSAGTNILKFDGGLDQWDFPKPVSVTGNVAATSVSFGSTALDAYEEGTFSPVYSDGTNNAVAYTTQAGFYTLTGDICKFNIRLAPNNIGSVSGSLQIKGLPFAAKNTSNYYSGIAVHWANNLAITAGQAVTGYIQLNQSVIYMHLWDATTGTTALTSTEWPVNGAIILSGEYKIS